MPIDTDIALQSNDATLTRTLDADELTEVCGEPAGTATQSAETSPALDDTAGEAGSGEPRRTGRRITRSAVIAYAVLPVLILLLGAAAGFLKYKDFAARTSEQARVESLASAKDALVALLSYRPATVEKDLGDAARDKLTGPFKDSYSQLVRDVVIPGAQAHRISAAATVPAAASVSASPSHAVALLFINQTVVAGDEAPSDSTSSVRVTLDKVGTRWLVAGFEPV